MSKVLLYCWVSNGIRVLVPKKRGIGYLRVPYGHHNNPGLNAAADSVAADVYGLDGALDFDSSEIRHAYTHWCERAAITETLVPLLEAHYQMDAKEIDTVEFWALHPMKGDAK